MLPKINRLTKKKDFDVVFKNGESIKNGFLAFKILKNNLKESRFGFVVSKKVSNKATIRNKVKRRLRDATHALLKEVKKPTDVVVVSLPGIEKKDFLEIQKLISDSFKKLKII